MTFNEAYLDLRGHGGKQLNGQWWHYMTEDNLTTVRASGYFNDWVAELLVGDLIFVVVVDDQDGPPATVYQVGLHVVTNNSGTVVDVSDNLLGGYSVTDQD